MTTNKEKDLPTSPPSLAQDAIGECMMFILQSGGGYYSELLSKSSSEKKVFDTAMSRLNSNKLISVGHDSVSLRLSIKPEGKAMLESNKWATS